MNTNRPVMSTSVSGNVLGFSWPANPGWKCYTNSVALTTNLWFTYPGSSSVTNANITINPAKSNVFFRMIYQ